MGDIALQHRRQISVEHGRLAARDDLHQRADVVADGDLREADVAGEFGEAHLVCGIAVAVHQHDGDRAEAFRRERRELRRRRGFVEGLENFAVGAHALVDFDDVA